MNKLLFILLVTFLISCNQHEQIPSYEITGMVDGLSFGNVFLLYSEFKDTTKIENGKFVFKGTIKEPCLSKLVFEGLDEYKEFYLENSIIKFKGSVDSIDKATISGSKTEDERISYNIILSTFDKKYTDIGNEYETADDKRKVELESLYEQTEMEQVKAQKQFIMENPSSYLCIKLLWEIDWSFHSSAELNDYLKILDTTLNKCEGLKGLKDLVGRMENVEIGKIAPDFEMNDINENIVKLSDLYSKSNYLLLDFWASHCGPCRKENANICKAYEMFCNKGFDVLGVSTDTKKELWLTAIEKDGLIWTNVSSLKKWGDNETVKTYALRQVSQNFLVDNSGKIIAKDLRGDELITKLDELLNLKRAKNK